MVALKVVLPFAALGLLLPLALLVMDHMSDHGWWPNWISYVWPTSYMFVATGAIVDRFWYEIAALSISLNVLLYGAVGLVLWLVLKKASGAEGRVER